MCVTCVLLSHTPPSDDQHIQPSIHALCMQFKQVSTDVFDQFKVNGVLDPAVDVEYNTLHQG